MSTHDTALESAGMVVLSTGPQGPCVALLHHREPPEWRLPKGKLHPGETPRDAARRELEEELGLCLLPGEELGETSYTYPDPRLGRVRKSVRFFLAHAPGLPQLRPEQPTFDQACWASPDEALRLLTWENERALVLLAFAQQEQTGPESPPGPASA